MINIALDGMGGDNAPGCMVDGAVDALRKDRETAILLVGREDVLKKELDGKDPSVLSRIEIVPATEVITNEEHPVEAIRRKKDSSIVVGLRLVHDGRADAFASCGSTGAVLAGGQLLAGRMKGVRRAPLAALIPTTQGPSLLVDSGANVDAKASDLLQFAQMGSVYMEHVVGVRSPRVAVLNIGTEEEKGNALVKETYPLLKEASGIHFIGSIESREIPFGAADVIVTDAFAGNVALKMYEGVAKALLKEIKGAMMSSLTGKIGGLLVKPSLKNVLQKFDASEYGGAPMLGLRGLVVKAHGNATPKEVSNTVRQCATFVREDITGKIGAILQESGPQ